MNKQKKTYEQRQWRSHRTRAKIAKTEAAHPRLSIFRSNKHMHVQLINDVEGKTIVSASSQELKTKGTKLQKAEAVGALIADKAKKAGVSKVVFDRGQYKYHGRVKAAADAARKEGLEF